MMKSKLFATVMVAGALLASCSKETNFGGESSVPEGIPTYAAISVSVNCTGVFATRAVSQDGEKELTSVDILIFDARGVLETYAQNVTNQAGTYNVKTTTGQKTVYAVANNLVSGIKQGMTLTAFEQLSYEAAKADGVTHKVDVPIAKASNFLMFGKTEATLTEQEPDTPNKVSLTVTRAAAKSQLLFKNVQASDSFQPENVALTFDDASTQLAQLQPTMYVVAPAQSTGTVTPWDDNYTSQAANWIAAREKDFDTNNDSEMITVVEYSHYLSENINATPLMNTTTCMLVRVKATPTTWSDDGGTQQGSTFYALVKFTSDTDKTFETIDSYYGIYKDEATAQTVLDSGALQADPDKAKYGIVAFTDGYCYYRLNLRDMTQATSAARYSVLRNNFYKVTVTEINNLGWNNPGDLVDPEDKTPVETETSLEVTITVADWTDVDMNEPLG